MKKTKKVFDLGLFVDERREDKSSDEVIMKVVKLWALECHGLTEEEINKKNHFILPSWMKEVEVEVEVEVEYELSKKEIEILKALKVLDYKWIARDENNYLYAYELKPFKMNSFYHVPHNTRLNSTLFPFISWEDEEPTSVEELLKNDIQTR